MRRNFAHSLIILFLTVIFVQPVYAQTTGNCGTGTINQATGLISAPTVTGGFVTSGGCVVDPTAPFKPFKIPSYADLKSRYYDQSKLSAFVKKNDSLTGSKNQSDISTTGDTTDNLYYITGNLNIGDAITGTRTKVVFVDGNLRISSPIARLACVDDNSGVVFIVQGDVNIDTSVTEINALIVSQGTICTAYDGTNCLPAPGATGAQVTPQLVVNGSLISLDVNKPIQFRRNLLNNNPQPAEKISHQVKYLVILRNLIADTSQIWTEVDPSIPLPTSQPVSVVATPEPTTGSAGCLGTCHDTYSIPDGSCGLTTCQSNISSYTTPCPTNTCHGDFYGYNGTDCNNNHLICLSNASSYANQTTVCGTNAQGTIDNHTACNADNSLRTYYTGTATGPTCNTASCSYPYSPSGNHNSVCGTTFTGTVDNVPGTWDTASACANSTTRNTYYEGNSCTQNGICNWPKPIDCAALDATSCHGDVSGYSGSSPYGCDSSRKTCLSNSSGYANQATACGTNAQGTIDNHTACNGDNTLKIYYTGTSTGSVCNTASCSYPYSPSGNHNSVCGATFSGTIDHVSGSWDTTSACANSTTLNTYYDGQHCTQNPCNWPKPIDCAVLDATSCHGDVSGYSGSSPYGCDSSRKTCLSNSSGYANQTTVCGTNASGAIDNHTACNTDNSLKTYYKGTSTGATCDTGTCGYPYSPGGNQSTCTTACLNSTTRNTYYDGQHCTQTNCPLPASATCPTNQCHGDIYGYNGTDCSTGHLICASNASGYSDPAATGQKGTCGTNVSGTLDNHIACNTDNSLKTYYTGTATGTTCNTASCNYPYSPGGNHYDVCGTTFSGTIDGTAGTWDDGSNPSKACANSTTRNTYYTGSSCSRTGTCNWPKPIDCAALDATSCHGDTQGYSGSSPYGCDPTRKTCLTNYHTVTISSCPTDGCSNPAGGGTQAKYTSNGSCSDNNAFCPINTTDNRCSTLGDTHGCTSASGGSYITYHTASTCNASNCTPTSTQLQQCPNSGGNYICYTGANIYYHAANTCSATLCDHRYVTTPTNSVCTTDGCIDGTAGGNNGPIKYASGSSCSSSDASCGITASSNGSNNRCSSLGDGHGCTGLDGSPITYHGSTCTATNCNITSTISICQACYTGPDVYYHPDNSCGKVLCQHHYVTSPPSSSCPSDGCSNPAGGSTINFATGADCSSTSGTCNVYDTSNRCSTLGDTHGCTGLNGSFITYHTGSSCATVNCNPTSTQTAVCPAGQCYAGADQYYHAAGTCGQSTCPRTYAATSSCPIGGCSTIEGTATSGITASSTTDNSCTSSNSVCTISDTSNYCPGGNTSTCYTGADRYYHPANTCNSLLCQHNYLPQGSCDTTSCHPAYSYTGPNSCTANNLTCAATYTSFSGYFACSSCSTSCTSGPATCYNGSDCTGRSCPNNYYSTCYTGSSDCSSTACYGANSVRCFTGDSCTSRNGWCPSHVTTTNTQGSCDYCNGRTTYTNGSDCDTHNCSTNYHPATGCDYCGGTRTYWTGNSCSQTACSPNYHGPTTPPACRTANTQYWSGNSCGQSTAYANCGTSCGGSGGSGCLINSWLLYNQGSGGGNRVFWFEDNWRDVNSGAVYSTSSSGWWGTIGYEDAEEVDDVIDEYNCHHYTVGHCYWPSVQSQISAHLTIDGINRTAPAYPQYMPTETQGGCWQNPIVEDNWMYCHNNTTFVAPESGSPIRYEPHP